MTWIFCDTAGWAGCSPGSGPLATLGTFLRSFTFGHVRQLDAAAAQFLVGSASNAPILPGAGQVCYVDIDDTIKATYGYQKQGAGYGYRRQGTERFAGSSHLSGVDLDRCQFTRPGGPRYAT